MLSFLDPVPNAAGSGHAAPGPRSRVMSTGFPGSGAGSGHPHRTEHLPPNHREVHPPFTCQSFNDFISHLIRILASRSGLFTSFQMQRYLKGRELAVEMLPVSCGKSAYTSLQGGFLIFLGKPGQMRNRS